MVQQDRSQRAPQAGEVVGERRFLGLFTSSAYNASVTQVPYVAEKVQRVVAASGWSSAGPCSIRRWRCATCG